MYVCTVHIKHNYTNLPTNSFTTKRLSKQFQGYFNTCKKEKENIEFNVRY